MGEVGGLAVDHADAGAALGAATAARSTRDSSIDSANPRAPRSRARRSRRRGRARARATRPASSGSTSGLSAPSALCRASPATSISWAAAQEQLAARLGLGVEGGRLARRRSRRGRTACAGEPAAAQVGRRLVGVAGDPVEEHAVGLRRHQAASAAVASAAAQVAQHGAHVEEHQRGEREAVGDGDHREPAVANRERLAVLGADVDVRGGLRRAARVGGGEQPRGRLAPAPRLAARGERRSVGGEDRAAAQVRRHLLQQATARSASAEFGGVARGCPASGQQ